MPPPASASSGLLHSLRQPSASSPAKLSYIPPPITHTPLPSSRPPPFPPSSPHHLTPPPLLIALIPTPSPSLYSAGPSIINKSPLFVTTSTPQPVILLKSLLLRYNSHKPPPQSSLNLIHLLHYLLASLIILATSSFFSNPLSQFLLNTYHQLPISFSCSFLTFLKPLHYSLASLIITSPSPLFSRSSRHPFRSRYVILPTSSSLPQQSSAPYLQPLLLRLITALWHPFARPTH